MTYRISKKLVTFLKPFRLERHDQEWPAGNYTIETEEEALDGDPSLGVCRLQTTMVVRPPVGKPGTVAYIDIDPRELDAALERDALDSEFGQADRIAS